MYALLGFSLSSQSIREEETKLFNWTNLHLRKIDPVYAIPEDIVEEMKNFFK